MCIQFAGGEFEVFVRLSSLNNIYFSVSLSVAQQLISGLGCLIVELTRSHTIRYTHTRYDSKQVISSSQRPLPTQTNNKHNRRTSMPSAEFEPAIPAIKRPQIYVLDRTATLIGYFSVTLKRL
jgi:hypothetical protein